MLISDEQIRSAVPAWAADYIGIPYLSGGRDRSGVDCWGLIRLVWAEQFGHELPRYEGADYSGPDSAAGIAGDAQAYAAGFRPVEPGQEQAGDGILLRLMARPIHVGLVIAAGRMLHIEEGAGSVIEPYTSIRWAKRVQGFYRHEVRHG